MHTRAIYYIFICVWGSNSRADVTETRSSYATGDTIPQQYARQDQMLETCYIPVPELVHAKLRHCLPSILHIVCFMLTVTVHYFNNNNKYQKVVFHRKY